MSAKIFLTWAAIVAGASIQAAPLIFNSATPAGNASARASWLAACGIASPDILADFEALPLGNIHGVANVYPGLTVTSSNSIANVTNSSGALGGSTPIGLQAMAAAENQLYTLSFASPVDYIGLLHMDLNTLGITVTYTDNSTTTHTVAGSGGSQGNTAVFVGIYRNDKPGIQSIVLDGNGGDNEWGVDNIEYGAVPEPATMVAVAAGILGLARRRRRA